MQKSRTYLLPLLNDKVPLRCIYLIENVHIASVKGLEEFDPIIALEYKDDSSKEYLAMVMEYMESEHFLAIIGPEEGVPITTFLFQLPKDYIDDYNYFIRGKYSKISKDAKTLIINFTKIVYRYQPLTDEVIDVLYKRESRRKKMEVDLNVSIPQGMELSSIINMEEEVFNYDLK